MPPTGRKSKSHTLQLHDLTNGSENSTSQHYIQQCNLKKQCQQLDLTNGGVNAMILCIGQDEEETVIQ